MLNFLAANYFRENDSLGWKIFFRETNADALILSHCSLADTANIFSLDVIRIERIV